MAQPITALELDYFYRKAVILYLEIITGAKVNIRREYDEYVLFYEDTDLIANSRYLNIVDETRKIHFALSMYRPELGHYTYIQQMTSSEFEIYVDNLKNQTYINNIVCYKPVEEIGILFFVIQVETMPTRNNKRMKRKCPLFYEMHNSEKYATRYYMEYVPMYYIDGNRLSCSLRFY